MMNNSKIENTIWIAIIFFIASMTIRSYHKEQVIAQQQAALITKPMSDCLTTGGCVRLSSPPQPGSPYWGWLRGCGGNKNIWCP